MEDCVGVAFNGMKSIDSMMKKKVGRTWWIVWLKMIQDVNEA